MAKQAKDEVQLNCGVYGFAEIFCVNIARDAVVADLRDVIAGVLGFRSGSLTLRVARKGGEGWLEDNDDLDTMLAGDVDTAFEMLEPTAKLPELLINHGEKYGVIHVLVERPQEDIPDRDSYAMAELYKSSSDAVDLNDPNTINRVV
ncbi:hypothetical protein PHYSODRAFT_261684 [Phytophthora sojae]|uniref:Crinkler effector protein N-terminal domain-containing protein n=1 Tax=Phytophthora sojae (strain P6497) TaxID=1094619 RepID=G5A0C5_PHYSP|nr:hypothetical protein PHYSODRAFT_261684 [Phytophthora sojae]EGZ10514.1 hypothetical protein PHYSODRAFT_261684 [Phytophthora sojae]|eukprot:XP_009533259.1 hypothetical protein PHYSODRAFT_261684 [Phytophthora sojae]